jgi:hypothetical protein
MTKVDYLIGFAGVEFDPYQDLKHLFQAPIFCEKAEGETARKLTDSLGMRAKIDPSNANQIIYSMQL